MNSSLNTECKSMSQSRTLVRPPLTFSILFFAAFFLIFARSSYGEIHILQAKTNLPPFEYMPAADNLPNYVAGAKWGTQAQPIQTMQKPLSPESSLPHLVMAPGFEAQLFAAEPEITKPIAMAWDARGRLWIAETVDYPNDMKPAGQGRDRIKICEDTNGDGKADKFTIFAENLSIPTSLVFANGGVIVAQAPDMVFLKDTNGDDRADERRVLFTGWGTSDTHAGPSNLRWGFDNWIWGTVGYSGFDGVVGGKKHQFGMGIYRFKPDGSALEFVRSSNNNTWGLGLSEDGTVFGSTANGNASMYMPIPNRFYEKVDGWSANRLETIADSQAFYPITAKVRQVDWHGKYTAGAGHALYTARSFPKNFWNRISFVCEPTGHLIGFFELEAKGSDYVAHNAGSFLGSDDEWTAPIAAEVGPDGSLWMIDWYNYIVQHNPVPLGFKNGKGNAYDTQLRDKRHGRIYRLTWKEGKPSKTPDLAKAPASRWIAALKSDNLLWRMQAQRLLVERGQTDVVPALEKLVTDRSKDALGLNPGALHALWTLDGLKAAETSRAVLKALDHPSASVRRAAVNVLPRTADSLSELLKHELLFDTDAQVRLATLLALAEMPSSPDAGVVVQAMLQSSRNFDDRWIQHAAVSAGATHWEGFLRASIAKGATTVSPPVGDSISLIAGHVAMQRQSAPLLALITSLKGSSPSVSIALLEGLVNRWPTDLHPSLDDTARKALLELMDSSDDRSQALLLTLSQRWGEKTLFAASTESVAKKLKHQLADENAVGAARVAAARDLIRIDDQAASIRVVVNLIKPQAPPMFTMGLINTLSESRSPETAEVLTQHWNQLTPTLRRAGLGVLFRRPEWIERLLAAVEAGTVPRGDLGPEHWQQLKGRPESAIASKAKALQASGNASLSPDREAVVQRLLPVAQRKGDEARGKEVFNASCAVCHTFNGVGGKVGPELTGIGARDRKDILTEILDPNRSVEANYRMWTATTKDGETFSGRLDTETQTTVEILDVAGQKHSLQRKDLQDLTVSNNSIMPVGFESLPESDLASLLEFLTHPH